MAKPISTVTVTIPAGESISNSVPSSAGTPVLLLSPADWDGGYLTFQVSFDDANYYDLYDAMNNLVTKSFRPGSNVSVIGDLMGLWLSGFSFRLRAGSPDDPVAQSLPRQFTIALAS